MLHIAELIQYILGVEMILKLFVYMSLEERIGFWLRKMQDRLHQHFQPKIMPL